MTFKLSQFDFCESSDWIFTLRIAHNQGSATEVRCRMTTQIRMTNGPKGRTQWKLEYGPERYLGNRTYAIFFDAYDSDRRVEVSIATRTLGQIGNPPSESPGKKQHAVEVLLTMLEEFEDEVKSSELTKIDETTVNMDIEKKNVLTTVTETKLCKHDEGKCTGNAAQR